MRGPWIAVTPWIGVTRRAAVTRGAAATPRAVTLAAWLALALSALGAPGAFAQEDAAPPVEPAPDESPPARTGPHLLEISGWDAIESGPPATSEESDPKSAAPPVPDPAATTPPAAPPPKTEPPKPESPTAGPSLPTAEQIAKKLAEIKAAGEADPPADKLTAEQRTAVLADLAAAAEARQRLDALTAARAAAEAAAEAVEAEMKQVQAQVDEVSASPRPERIRETFQELTDAAVVLERTKAENDRAQLARDRENFTEALSGERREADRAALRAAMKAAADAAAAAETQAPSLPTDVAGARVAKTRLGKAAAAAALAAADAENVRLAAAAKLGLPALRRSLFDRKIAAADARFAAAEAELNRRASEKARELADASIAEDVPPALRPLAEEVAALQESYSKQVSKRVSADQMAAKTKGELTALKNRWDRVADRVKDLGMSDVVSASLRRERGDMPALDSFTAAINVRLEEIERAQVAAADHRDAFAALPLESNHGKLASSLLTTAIEQGSLTGDQVTSANATARELLDTRRKLLTELAPGEGVDGLDRNVIESLFALQRVQTEFRDTAAAFAEYIDERVLWVRSGRVINKEQLEAELPIVAGWAAPDALRATARSILEALLAGVFQPLTALALAGCVALGFLRMRLRGLLARWAIPGRRKGSLDYESTLAALAATLPAACAAPAALTWLSYVLTGGWIVPPTDSGVAPLPPTLTAAALGTAAGYAAAVALPLALLRALTRRDGLADAHFQWTAGAVRRIQRQARWFAPPLLTAAAIAGLLGSSDPLHAGGGWERVAFTVACGLAATLMYRLFRPGGVVWDGVRKTAPESPSHKFRVPLCAVAVLGTAALGGSASPATTTPPANWPAERWCPRCC